MTKKDLEQFLIIKEEIKQLNEQKKMLEERKTSIKSQVITDLPKGGGTVNLLEDIIIEIEETIVEIAKKSAELANKLLEIENIIEDLDPIERMLMRYKYLMGMTFTRMEFKMGYSTRQLIRIHAKILKKLEDKIS